MQVLSHVSSAFGVDISLGVFLEESTIRSLAASIEEQLLMSTELDDELLELIQ